MAIENNRAASRHLQVLFNLGAVGALSDGQLLEWYATRPGEARELAFAALIERHGLFVFRVCRAILGDEHEAHDAFQATFLALARKAHSLYTRDSLAPWLHAAAYRAACHDRAARIRRQTHERAAATLRTERVEDGENREDFRALIHEEVDRLPVRYRNTVVLCDLQGQTLEQAARHLGCAVGTIKSRLARGREKLRGRLIRRGVAPAIGLTAALTGGRVQAAMPAGLAESTVRFAVCGLATAEAIPAAVVVLRGGVLMSLMMRKLKVAGLATVVVGALTAGAVVSAQQGKERAKDASSSDGAVATAKGLTYEILVSKDGLDPRKVAVVNIQDGQPRQIETPDAVIEIRPKPSLQIEVEALSRRYHEALDRIEGERTKDLSRASLDQEISSLMNRAGTMDVGRQLVIGKDMSLAFPPKPDAPPGGKRWQDLDDAAKQRFYEVLKTAIEESGLPLGAVSRDSNKASPGKGAAGQPLMPATADTSQRLDQLEKKLDLLIDSLKKPGGAPTAPASDPSTNVPRELPR